MKLAVVGLLAAFVLFYIITSPDQAADIANGSWNFVVKVAHGIGDFVDKLAS
ncbi:hypothetical protein SAMN05443575_1024 [Jatrophihabitans endophyticus]|uniref:Uncharacterized protein n=1 Tax=Jatrophihabitans endophyticus TaxID=1206085 RepID=A0A1M5EW50_9ACTN|nr:hypothetical protein [Jatrophihabitans endophyticus]SHF83427.1 hypothetical protein SAMN05443575_1024 [Jatrophihabitans endophyticus]